jgi:hypothetical protein
MRTSAMTLCGQRRLTSLYSTRRTCSPV